MTQELMQKLIDIVYESKNLSLTEKVELMENFNLFLQYYDENMKALEEIARKNKKGNK